MTRQLRMTSHLSIEPKECASRMTQAKHVYPRGPVLDWGSFKVVDAPGIGSVEDLPHIVFTTSGRAAIYHALLQLNLPPGSLVLVPTYHCPTMVAPVLQANLRVGYFGLTVDGLPDLSSISPDAAGSAKAILVSHYFGIARSLADVRAWCDQRQIALIEDCAHCYFGAAGERPVGAWGDYCTASLAKFLPFSEGGLLGSALHPIRPLRIRVQGLKAQLKGAIDILEMAARYNRLTGLNCLVGALLKLRPGPQSTGGVAMHPAAATAGSMMRDCDMGRIESAPLWTTSLLRSILPRGRIIVQRQLNFYRYAKNFNQVQGARQLFAIGDPRWASAAPYVFPLWVDDADRVYAMTRKLVLPIFRWDRIWPGTPLLDSDVGPEWSRHVLQLLCHQNLGVADIDTISAAVLGIISKHDLVSDAGLEKQNDHVQMAPSST